LGATPRPRVKPVAVPQLLPLSERECVTGVGEPLVPVEGAPPPPAPSATWLAPKGDECPEDKASCVCRLRFSVPLKEWRRVFDDCVFVGVCWPVVGVCTCCLLNRCRIHSQIIAHES
jgi:hypothetical protein